MILFPGVKLISTHSRHAQTLPLDPDFDEAQLTQHGIMDHLASRFPMLTGPFRDTHTLVAAVHMERARINMLKTPSGELPNGVIAGKRMRVIFEFVLITKTPYRQSFSTFKSPISHSILQHFPRASRLFMPLVGRIVTFLDSRKVSNVPA